jgi:hypothetical protein
MAQQSTAIAVLPGMRSGRLCAICPEPAGIRLIACRGCRKDRHMNATSGAAPSPASSYLVVRPAGSGDPLDPSTDPTFPKPKGQIEIVETGSGLTLADRKLFNVLLALSWEKLADPVARLPPFRAPAALLRRAIGEEAEHDNARLRASFDRLMSCRVLFPYESADGTLKEGGAPLLSFRALPKGAGAAEWSFPLELRPMLAEPGAWARLHLTVCARFQSKYALTLYELLSVRANLRAPAWRVTVDELRALLGARDKLPNWRHFERRVLEPAVYEVNELSPLAVAYGLERDTGRGRRVVAVAFTIARKDLPALVDAARLDEFASDPVGPAGGATARDPRTLDMQDGRTDEERGGRPPSAAEAFKARVPAKVLREVAAEFPGLDVAAVLDAWASWAAGSGKPCRNPAAAFRGFARQRAAELSALPAPVPAAAAAGPAASIAAALDDRERRALVWLIGQPYGIRRRWWNRACELGADDMRAATAEENIPRWIGLVAGEVCP